MTISAQARLLATHVLKLEGCIKEMSLKNNLIPSFLQDIKDAITRDDYPRAQILLDELEDLMDRLLINQPGR